MSDPTKAPVDEPQTPPTEPVPAPAIYAQLTIFGWLTAAGGGAIIASQHANETWWSLGAGVALVLFGGTCINRDPIRIFAQAIGGWISAWRGHGDDHS